MHTEKSKAKERSHYMTKQELQQYGAIKQEVEQIDEELARLKSSIMSARGQIITDMPRASSPEGDSLSKGVIKMVELEYLYQDMRTALCDKQIEIERALKVLNPTERRLMRYRYIDGMTWEKIADKMHYSLRDVFYKHKSALKKIAVNCTQKCDNM